MCVGVNSFHASMSNEAGLSMLRDSDLYRLFRECKQLGALTLVHAENGALVAEVVALGACSICQIQIRIRGGSRFSFCEKCILFASLNPDTQIHIQTLK